MGREANGPMLVIDASVLFEVVVDSALSEGLRGCLVTDDEHAAPHLIDPEVLSVVQSALRRGALDPTAASQAVSDLALWPGVRYPHQPLLERAWELRHNVRGHDAMYVALAEALGATLLTLDHRLASTAGIACTVEVPKP